MSGIMTHLCTSNCRGGDAEGHRQEDLAAGPDVQPVVRRPALLPELGDRAKQVLKRRAWAEGLHRVPGELASIMAGG
jgi:hypothetical protein